MEITIKVEDKRTCKVGDMFHIDRDITQDWQKIVVLTALGDSKMTLVSLGGFCDFPVVKVKDVFKVTADELGRLVDGEFLSKCDVSIKWDK